MRIRKKDEGDLQLEMVREGKCLNFSKQVYIDFFLLSKAVTHDKSYISAIQVFIHQLSLSKNVCFSFRDKYFLIGLHKNKKLNFVERKP